MIEKDTFQEFQLKFSCFKKTVFSEKNELMLKKILREKKLYEKNRMKKIQMKKNPAS